MSDTNTPTHHAVVGFDGSANSAAALRWAFDHVSRLGGGSVKVVMSWTFSASAGVGYGLGYSLPPADSMQEASVAALDESLVGIEPPEGVTLEPVVREGPPAKVLIEEAEDAEILVIGKRGHGGFLGLMIGSTANQVANHATCPVVIVPSED